LPINFVKKALFSTINAKHTLNRITKEVKAELIHFNVQLEQVLQNHYLTWMGI